jgi:hypothetical protein
MASWLHHGCVTALAAEHVFWHVAQLVGAPCCHRIALHRPAARGLLAIMVVSSLSLHSEAKQHA